MTKQKKKNINEYDIDLNNINSMASNPYPYYLLTQCMSPYQMPYMNNMFGGMPTPPPVSATDTDDMKSNETCLYELKDYVIPNNPYADNQQMPSLEFSKFINHIIDEDPGAKKLAINHRKITISGTFLLAYIMDYFSGDETTGTDLHHDHNISVYKLASMLMNPQETNKVICLSTMNITIGTVLLRVCPSLIMPQHELSDRPAKIKIIKFLQFIRNSFESPLEENSAAASRNYYRCRLMDTIIEYAMKHKIDCIDEEVQITYDTYFDNLTSTNRDLFIDRWNSINDFTAAL